MAVALPAIGARPTRPTILKYNGFRAGLSHNSLSRASGQLVLGERMSPANQPSLPELLAEDDQVDDAALAEVMRTVPLGAGVLAGTAVALLVIGYLAIYLLVFLPRGPVG